MREPNKTRWSSVLVVFAAGCLTAAMIGKVASALSHIMDELSLTLFQGGLVVSLFSLTAAVSGILLGMLSGRIGQLRGALIGLACCALGSAIGATAEGFWILIGSRLIEGLGFILAMVSMPPLIQRATTIADRPVAMGLWGAFMPVGMGSIMIASPYLLDVGGWRGTWNLLALICVLWTALLWMTVRSPASDSDAVAAPRLSIKQLLLNRITVLMFSCFVLYSMLYTSISTLLPTLLVEQQDALIEVASAIGAAVVLANIIGNFASGWLVKLGVNPWKLLLAAFIVMGSAGSLVFPEATSPTLKLITGVLFSAVGGLIPGTLFVIISRIGTAPAEIALFAGTLLQGAGIGQVMGPTVTTYIVENSGGWQNGSILMLVLGCMGVMMSIQLGRALVRPGHRGG